MEETGYKWDAEKKQLTRSQVIKKCEQDIPTNWTEEDEKMFEEYKLGIQALMKDAYVEKFCNWIFSLKQRLLQ